VKNAAGRKQAGHLRNSFSLIQIPLNCSPAAELIRMPQIPNLINLGFIALLLLEVVLDAVMRRDLYHFKDAAASLAMGTGSVLLGVVSKALVFAAYTAVNRSAIFNIGYQWWAWAVLFFAEDLTYYVMCFIAPATNAGSSGLRTWSIIRRSGSIWAPRCGRPGPAVSCHSSSGCGCLWSAFRPS